MGNTDSITTGKMIELGFIEKPKSFRKNKLFFKKHPTMNWLISKDSSYLKTMDEVHSINDKCDLCYAVRDLCALVDMLFENNSIHDNFIEWAYNSKCNSQNLLIDIERRSFKK